MSDHLPSGEATAGEPQELKRALSQRHLQLIAIGGAIGTGLFFGSGKTISTAGPMILVLYLIIGSFLFFVMRAMGELLLSNFAYHTFADFATDLIGPWAGFYVGWTYWVCWVIIGVADSLVIAAYLEFWLGKDYPHYIAVITTIIVLISLNMVAVSVFGEMEFWFAIIKVVTIIALIIAGIYLIVTGFTSPTGEVASINNLFKYGFWPKAGIMGVLAAVQICVYSFQGIEMVGTAAAETSNPEKNLPDAINTIPVRIILFYVLSLAVIMCVEPWINIEPGRSPFTTMFSFAGIAGAAGIMQFVVTTSAASSANAGVYSTSRLMYGMSRDHLAPQIFAKLNSRGVPKNALMLTLICLSPAVALSFSESMAKAFDIVAGASAVLYITVWVLIMICYLQYRKKHPDRHAESKFPMLGGIPATYATLVFFAVLFAILAVDPDARKTLIALPIWFIFMWVMYKWIHARFPEGHDLDFDILREEAHAKVMADTAAVEAAKEAKRKNAENT
ncbi:amino acid permease [Stomatohabitans albus]|uniref:amino acid permease n=1 Tax=Stomatohabitans albus TaxID=3110766 RepID=UPI00300C6EDE